MFSLASFVASSTIAIAAFVGTPAQSQPMPVAPSVKEYVQGYFADKPVMVEIARCESQFRQFDEKGNVLKNPKSSAVGIFQIMYSIHDSAAKSMKDDDFNGLDINTVPDNVKYAEYLYDTQGTTPWNASKACWGKTAA